jgi:deoxyribodipyrimidine photolyase-like uncharacterized protein
MPPRPTPSGTVLSTRFQFRDPVLLWARMRLYADRLELKGWRVRGRYSRQIRLQQVLQADATSDDSLLLWLSTGETVRFRVREAPRWKRTIEEQKRLLRTAP